MTRLLLIATLVALAGCVQLPPTPQEIQAKKFEAAPGKAVIYIVRNDADSRETGTLLLDHQLPLTTYHRTFYRWEVAPGMHRVAGYAGDSSAIELDVQAGHIYFVEYTVLGRPMTGWSTTFLRTIGDQSGRRLVRGAGLL